MSDTSLDEFKIVVFMKVSMRKYVLQSSGSWKDTNLVELSTYKWNTKRMRVINAVDRALKALALNV